MPTPNPGDLDVTADTLSCRSGPLPLLTAQLYFQNTFVDGVSTTVSTAHAEVDTRALSSTSLCEGISQIRLQKFITHWSTEFCHPWWKKPQDCAKKVAQKTSETGFETTMAAVCSLWHIVLTRTAAIIKCACLTDADFTYLLIYNHVYFYLVCIYIYLCLFTSHLSQWNANLLFRLLVIAVWLTVLLCSVLSWCIAIWQLICSFDFLLFTLWS